MQIDDSFESAHKAQRCTPLFLSVRFGVELINPRFDFHAVRPEGVCTDRLQSSVVNDNTFVSSQTNS